MYSATRTCPKCDGTGFRPVFGPFHLRCRPCKGTGVRLKMSARIWARLRYGSGEDY